MNESVHHSLDKCLQHLLRNQIILPLGVKEDKVMDVSECYMPTLSRQVERGQPRRPKTIH